MILLVRFFMNVCIAYTSREEMTMAVRDICTGVAENKIGINDINEDLIEQCLYTSHSRPVDLLVRTSGEVRLSDFLLWQVKFERCIKYSSKIK
jgi:ditrans,polycis-polyprenyl diphosphate synthase